MAEAPAAAAPRERIALVLGAGGARGLAQIGVIEALLAREVEVVAVAGSSIGALVGGVFAAGGLDTYRDWLCSLGRNAMLRLLDPGLGASLFRGERLLRTLRELIGEPRIEDLPLDYTAVAVDLIRQREVWLRHGDLWDAIRASFAIPGIFTPHVVHGRALVDGGLLAPLPITATRLSDAQRLIAVDMHGWPRRPVEDAPDPDPGAPPSRLARWWSGHFREQDRVGVESGAARALGFSELMARSLDTMQAQISRVHLALDPPDLVIRIPRDACGFHEFWRARELIELGRACAGQALDAAGLPVRAARR